MNMKMTSSEAKRIDEIIHHATETIPCGDLKAIRAYTDTLTPEENQAAYGKLAPQFASMLLEAEQGESWIEADGIALLETQQSKSLSLTILVDQKLKHWRDCLHCFACASIPMSEILRICGDI